MTDHDQRLIEQGKKIGRALERRYWKRLFIDERSSDGVYDWLKTWRIDNAMKRRSRNDAEILKKGNS